MIESSKSIRVSVKFYSKVWLAELYINQGCFLEDKFGFTGVGKHRSADLTPEQLIKLQELLATPEWCHWTLTVL